MRSDTCKHDSEIPAKVNGSEAAGITKVSADWCNDTTYIASYTINGN